MPAQSQTRWEENVGLVKDSFAFRAASGADLIRKIYGEMVSYWCWGCSLAGAGGAIIVRRWKEEKTPFDTLKHFPE